MATKERLLALLETHKGEYLSGEELAEQLNISRTAVWKAVKSLRSAGYKIQAAQNRGYCLDASTDVLDVQGIRNYLEPCAQGCQLELVHCTASTNPQVRQRAAGGAAEGLVILANQQTKGRGRMGREFYSPPDTGLYMSLLLRPGAIPPAQAIHITTMAAVAACLAIDALCPRPPQIKWVNDILLGGQKVCGILTEGSFDRGREKPAGRRFFESFLPHLPGSRLRLRPHLPGTQPGNGQARPSGHRRCGAGRLRPGYRPGLPPDRAL